MPEAVVTDSVRHASCSSTAVGTHATLVYWLDERFTLLLHEYAATALNQASNSPATASADSIPTNHETPRHLADMIQLRYEGYLLRPQNSLPNGICWDSNISYISLCHEPGRQNS